MFLLSESFGMFCLTYPLILIYGGVLGGVPLARIGDFSSPFFVATQSIIAPLI
ncbi:hypothetical protein ACEWYO_01725 [Helicobacter pylori]